MAYRLPLGLLQVRHACWPDFHLPAQSILPHGRAPTIGATLSLCVQTREENLWAFLLALIASVATGISRAIL